MNTQNWKISPREVLTASPVMPVMVIHDADDAVPMAKALCAGGVRVLEITLRTSAAIAAIKQIKQHVPEAIVGAGTVINTQQLKEVTEAGAVFAISPGLTPTLLQAANQGEVALIPGISTLSELIMGMEYGYEYFKFFPAEAAGGISMLKAIAGPIPQATFCPTGGISPQNYQAYLKLDNVACVGGSWLVPSEAVKNKDWNIITELARTAIANARMAG